MALLRDDPDFGVAIERAARELGQLDPSFVEKDYWVTQVLRALFLEYPGAFLFKGGTSLSKGYGIIERFSEDVDVLMVPPAGYSNAERERHLSAVTGAVAAHLGLAWEQAREPGRGRDASRGDYVRHDPVVDAGVRIGVGPGAVLLETAYGGQEPSEMVDITPILCEPNGIDPSDYEDTERFQVRALEPRRTLIEKLFAVHHLATRWQEGDDLREQQRFGRHFYDIYKLLEHDETVRKLREDREGFAEITLEVERVSRVRFGGTTPRPADGFAVSPAFDHDREGELRAWLERNYGDALALLPRDANAPSFGQVMRRVEGFGELL